jgi:hypothetical protein
VWSREIDGLRLTFHLAGINNQNFLMRDEETGTYWQQISGAAISGPLKGRHLILVPSDELNFSTWKAEAPGGTVLEDVPRYASQYAEPDWDIRMKRVPTVIDFPERGLAARSLMLGVEYGGASRAFPYEQVLAAKLVRDHVGSDPVLLVVGPDGESVRAFRARIPGLNSAPDFYRATDNSAPGLLIDSATGSSWNFQGCATSGPAQPACLEHINVIKDYWFDWRNYHPQTTVWRQSERQ